MPKAKKVVVSNPSSGVKETVFVISGVNYGGAGYRAGLWSPTAEKMVESNPGFIMWVGGIADRHWHNDCLKGVPSDERVGVEASLVEEVASHYQEYLPEIPGKKYYIITSPAFDGDFGLRCAVALARKRKDIRILRSGADRCPLKGIKAVVEGLTPERNASPFRSKYFSTSVDRIMEDKERQSTIGLGDFNVVGCLASMVLNLGDSTDAQAPYCSVPVLHKDADPSAEPRNQIGVAIVRFRTDNPKEASVMCVSFKDLVAFEYQLVQVPEGVTEIQRMVVEYIKMHGPSTIGTMVDDFRGRVSRLKIRRAIAGLKEIPVTSTWSGLELDELADRYQFPHSW
ncbi:MAG: hypothetical protein WC797_02600, partial [Candidatus Paceibacterota bacterium]